MKLTKMAGALRILRSACRSRRRKTFADDVEVDVVNSHFRVGTLHFIGRSVITETGGVSTCEQSYPSAYFAAG
jgi:hypothetical protein